MDQQTLKWVFACLRITVFLLLVGHSWLNLIDKPALVSEYKSIGFHQPETIAQCVGGIELLSALAILLFPSRPLLLAIFLWKMSSELLYPSYELFEWIERGGSYAAILAFWYCLKLRALSQPEENLNKQISESPKQA